MASEGENGLSFHSYVIITYTIAIFVLVVCALYAVLRHTYYLVRIKHRDQNAEEFITARNTQTKWRIAWSFFASAVGAWCIALPAQYAFFTGIIGLLAYAIACGFPLFVLSLCGASVQKKFPTACTVGDFVGQRFGPTFRTMVSAVVLLGMSISLLAEFIAIGSIFKDFVGSVDYPIIIIVGLLTTAYTAYGGVYVSIMTDQIQGISTVTLVAILTIYTAVRFRPPRCEDALGWDVYAEDPLPPCMPKELPAQLAPNKYGYSAIFSMPCSLMAATVFSESLWQKVWASENRSSLLFGGAVGSVGVTLVVFILGFGGLLATWGGYVNAGYTNLNLILFQVFSSEQVPDMKNSSAHVRSWVGVITVLVAVIMNESAVDSFQTGLTATVTQHFFRDQHQFFARVIVIVINIPLMIISFQGYPILSVFLISNMLTTCGFIPILLGLWDRGRQYITESSCIVGFTCGILAATAFGIGRHWDPSDRAGSIAVGARYTWFDNMNYEWEYFAVGSGFSVVGMLLWIVPAQILKRFGIEGRSITQILEHIPGFDFVTGSGFSFDLMDTRVMRPIAKLLRYDPSQSAFAPKPAEPTVADLKEGIELTPVA